MKKALWTCDTVTEDLTFMLMIPEGEDKEGS